MSDRLFVSTRKGLFTIQRNGEDSQRLTKSKVASLLHPQVSPDGVWIAATQLVWRKEIRRCALD